MKKPNREYLIKLLVRELIRREPDMAAHEADARYRVTHTSPGSVDTVRDLALNARVHDLISEEEYLRAAPNSRETMAACEVLPPLSVTIALAIFMIGSQSGSVIFVIRISSFWNSVNFEVERMTRAFPVTIFFPTETPCATLGFDSFRVYSSIIKPFFSACTVSGLA